MLFKPTDPILGVGEAERSSPLILDTPGPNEDPYEFLLVPFSPPAIAFCNNGLADGENGEPEKLPPNGLSLPFPDNGDPELFRLLPGDPARGVGVLEYLGGVAYLVSGVAGFELGGRPRSFLCAGVRGISWIESVARKRGTKARAILYANTRCMIV